MQSLGEEEAHYVKVALFYCYVEAGLAGRVGHVWNFKVLELLQGIKVTVERRVVHAVIAMFIP